VYLTIILKVKKANKIHILPQNTAILAYSAKLSKCLSLALLFLTLFEEDRVK